LPHARRQLLAVLLLAGMVSPAFAGKPDEGPAPKKLVAVTYAVADLVTPVTFPVSTTGAAPDGKPAPSVKTTEDALMKRIMSEVAKTSWSEAGGQGTIDYFPLTMSLVINQTPAIEEQVADLLATWRRQQELEVALELRFLTVPDAPLAILGEAADGPRAADKVAYLNAAQARRFMDTVQNDPRANVMQAPKVTVFNGQKATLSICQMMAPDATKLRTCLTALGLTSENGEVVGGPKEVQIPVGVSSSLHPVIATDRRSVTLDLVIEVSSMEAELRLLRPRLLDTRRFSTKLSLPDGGSALLDMGERRQEVAPAPIPFLSDLPLVGSLLREIASRTELERVLVVVTPRIIAPQEREELKPPASEQYRSSDSRKSLAP
jgi:type II/III secretion system protein